MYRYSGEMTTMRERGDTSGQLNNTIIAVDRGGSPARRRRQGYLQNTELRPTSQLCGRVGQ